MGGLQRLCKTYGRININGVVWVWDYVQDKAVKESEMTHEQWVASERKKWEAIKERNTKQG